MEDVIKISGLGATQKALYDYSQQLGDKVVYASLRAGANIVKRQAVANAPRGKTLRLKKGIIVAKSRIHRGRFSGDLLGVYLTIRNKKKDDPFYGRMQEDGWNVHGVRKGSRRNITARFGTSTGRTTQPGKRDIPGKLFIKNAWTSRKSAAVEMIARTAESAADLLAKKMGL